MSSSLFARKSHAASAPAKPPVTAAASLRATLEGLEVQDSNWDEWVAAEALMREQQRQRAATAGAAQAPRR
ncbi:hypothetical protein [Inhella sp.]|uniref:hypothetical protein n=1 Tax=Inhella sp. TaxID=1921806 RepID=UPI0035ADB64A